MKRQAFICAVGCGVTLAALPAITIASRARLAIDVDSDGSIDSKALDRFINKVTGLLLRGNKFEIVDRARIAAAIREAGFSNSAYADPKTAASLGKIVGASRLLHVMLTVEAKDMQGSFVSNMSATASASYQLVSVATARIVAAGTADGSAQQRAAAGSPLPEKALIREALDYCASDLAGQLINDR